MEQEPVRPRALLSVWDKRDIVPFANGLAELGFELLSTGGTARTLREAGLTVTDVSQATGHPEIFDGRVKSLHPAIHGPLLARLEREDDAAHLRELGYPPIQVVAVNLYPFAEAASKDPPLAESDLLEMIDIGGPTLVRASAKNHRNVLIVVRPERYTEVLEALTSAASPESVGLDLRQALALEAFQQTSGYDTAIARRVVPYPYHGAPPRRRKNLPWHVRRGARPRMVPRDHYLHDQLAARGRRRRVSAPAYMEVGWASPGWSRASEALRVAFALRILRRLLVRGLISRGGGPRSASARPR
ncbi:MAG: hypothetical protein ACPIFP_04305, partial [Candidatus Poseidoniaceae archaeon]